jgi:anti-anti-sigma factor
MAEVICRVRWTGRQAVVTLPEHIGVSNAGQIRDELLAAIGRGVAVLIADMTATVSCDHAGADVMVRAYQRGVINGTQLRLVATAQGVRRVLSLSGLDRLVSIYPALETAIAAEAPAAVAPFAPRPAMAPARSRPQAADPSKGPPRAAAITPAVLAGLVDALTDGVALVDENGLFALVNRRLEDMFGYKHEDLIGHSVESLVPAGLRAAHRSHRAAYAQAPTARPMGARARLVGLREDGTTFPVKISISPVPTATGHFTLAVIRDITEIQQHADLADLAWAVVAAEQAHGGQKLLDRIVNHLFDVGLSLRAATDLPGDVARHRITQALRRLDHIVHEVREHTLTARSPGPPPA